VRKALGAWTVLLLAALHAPVVLLAAASFNAGKYRAWEGFSLRWYAELGADGAVRGALGNTLILSLSATAVATVLGTLAALAARRAFRGKRLYTALVSLPLTVPDLVLAIALLLLFRSLEIPLGLGTAAIAHATFDLAFVAILVSTRLEGLDRSLELAAQDLGETPWGAFWRVTFPAILPGVAAGALLAFTLSFDDFVITYFTAGAGNPNLPVLVYSMMRFGMSPKVNALSTVIFAVSVALVALSLRFSKVPVGGSRR
jgi:spermidine/putrescine transport system permease protein